MSPEAPGTARPREAASRADTGTQPSGTPRPVDPGDLTTYAVRLGDDALILAQRLGEWASRAPELEEDVALTNIALDLLGQARSLLSYAAEVEGRGRTEDDLAFLREEHEFVNVQLVEISNGDFAVTMARQLLFSTYQAGLYERLAHSTDAMLAGVAAKAVKEVAYHRDHAVLWTLRLGDGTDESHRRMQEGLDRVWPFAAELFEVDPLLQRLVDAGVAADPVAIRPGWEAAVEAVLTEAGLERPQTAWRPTGGRRGVHTEMFGYLLAEMQYLHRLHPGARW